jgi:hypothetical protein
MNAPINSHEQQTRDMMEYPELQVCCDMAIIGINLGEWILSTENYHSLKYGSIEIHSNSNK